MRGAHDGDVTDAATRGSTARLLICPAAVEPRGAHLEKWLWDWIDDRDLRAEDGQYCRVTEDQAVMLPMLEMSGTGRARTYDLFAIIMGG